MNAAALRSGEQNEPLARSHLTPAKETGPDCPLAIAIGWTTHNKEYHPTPPACLEEDSAKEYLQGAAEGRVAIIMPTTRNPAKP